MIQRCLITLCCISFLAVSCKHKPLTPAPPAGESGYPEDVAKIMEKYGLVLQQKEKAIACLILSDK